MKRQLLLPVCCILIFTMILPCTVFASGTFGEAKVSAAAAGALLNALGIFENYGEPNFNDETVITKAEMCNVIANIIYDGVSSGDRTVSYYYDVPYGHWALPGVNLLSETGIVSGDGTGYFYPDKEITLYECLKMWLCALDYNSLAVSNGGWPWGYYKTAAELDILDSVDVSDTERVTGAVLSQIIVNSLDVPFMNVKTENGNAVFETNPSDTDTILKRHNLTKAEGTVIKNDITSLTPDVSGEDEGFVNIDGERFKTGESNAGDYLGCEVEYYYEDTADGDIIRYAYPSNDISELVILSENIIDMSRSQLRYYDEKGTARTEKISSGASFIVNGKAAAPYDSIFDVENGEVRLREAMSGSDGYGVIFIDDYLHCIAASVSDDVLYISEGDYKGGRSIDLENADKLVITKSDKASVADDIVYGDALSVLASDDGAYIRIDVLSSAITGKVTAISDDKIYVNETEYELSAQHMSKNGTAISIGKEGTFVFDRYGKIFYTDFTSTGTRNYGFVFAHYAKPFNNEYHIKLMNTDSEFEEYVLSDKVRITNDAYDGKALDAADAYAVIESAVSAAPCVITYRANDAGKLSEVNLPKQGSLLGSDDITHRLDYTMEEPLYFGYSRFGDKVHIGESTKIFVVSETESGSYSENDSYVTGAYFAAGNVSASSESPVYFYNIADNGIADSVLVITSDEKSEFGSLGDSEYFLMHVFVSCVQMLDENGDEAEAVVCGSDEGTKRIVIAEDCRPVDGSLESDLRNMEFGDVFLYRANKRGEITDFMVVQKYSDFKNGSLYLTGGGYYQAYATAVSVFAGNVCTYDSKALRIKSDDTYFTFQNIGNTSFAMVDTDTETVSKATSADLKFYGSENAEMGSRVVLFASRNKLLDIIIFE